jgi:hypothetical protein
MRPQKFGRFLWFLWITLATLNPVHISRVRLRSSSMVAQNAGSTTVQAISLWAGA